MYRKLSCVLCAALTLTAVSAVQAAPEAADDISARLEKLLREQENLRQESKALLTDISALEKELPDTQTAQEAFEKNQAEKIAAAKARKKAMDEKVADAKPEVREQPAVLPKSADDVDLFGENKKTAAAAEKTVQSQPVQKSDEPALYPFQRQPVYSVPANTKTPQKRGRRPFIRSEIMPSGEEVFYARVHTQDKLSFAKEETTAYVGTTEQNIYVFSDNIANYCQLSAEDAAKNKNAKKCLDKIIELQSSSKQSDKRTAKELVNSSFMDDNLNSYASAVEHKVTASGFEEKVLIPSQEQFSKSTTERGDLQNLTLMAMEQTKTVNRLVDVYSTLLSLESFKNFSNFEVNSKEITDIEEQYKAQNSDD